MFTNPVVAGIQLVRNAISSVNFVSGVSGWIIRRDGTAEFASGTFRGPVLIIEPGTGATLASIGADGNASFQDVTVNDDLFIGPLNIGDWIASHGTGIKGQYRTTSNLPDSGTSGTYTNTCWTQFTYDVTRWYKVSGTTTTWQCNDAFGDSDRLIKVLINQPGVPGGASNETIHLSKQSSSAGESENLNVECYFGGATGRANGTMTVTLQMSTASGTAWTNINGATSEFAWTVEDVGLIPSSTGGSGAPAGSLTYIVQYPALESRSYDENGIFIGAPDGDDNVYGSQFPDRPYGDEQAEIIFDGARIATDLTGAAIDYARLYLYCHKAEEAQGSLGFSLSTDVTVQAGTAGSPYSENGWGDWGADDDWPVPGWAYFDLLTVFNLHTAISRFIDHNASAIQMHPAWLGLAATGFRGYGYSADKRPYIEVRYTGNAPLLGGYGGGGYGDGGYGD